MVFVSYTFGNSVALTLFAYLCVYYNIFCGDVKQDDLTSERKKEMSGLRLFMKVIKKMKEFNFIEFEASDIVRSKLVKSYIIERDRQGL